MSDEAKKQPAVSNIMACIDVSATMPAAMLESIKDHLFILNKAQEKDWMPEWRPFITIVEFDTQVRRVIPFLDWLRSNTVTAGTGGCDYTCLFDQTLRDQLKPKYMIIHTDGFGTAPQASPFVLRDYDKKIDGVLLIWVMCGDSAKAPATWGKTVKLHDISDQPSTAELRKERSAL